MYMYITGPYFEVHEMHVRIARNLTKSTSCWQAVASKCTYMYIVHVCVVTNVYNYTPSLSS